MPTSHDRGYAPPSRGAAPREDGPYVLRPLLDKIPLSADGSQEHVTINCIEYLDGNLYVGTSASKLLHFVQMPPDPTDSYSPPIFILASRLSPGFSGLSESTAVSQPGVQEMLLLPSVGKACVLCNSTVTFYTLPELSPVSGIGQVKNCYWIGGTDLNKPMSDSADQTAVDATILLSLKRRIQVVRVNDSVRALKQNINYAGSTLSVRRDSIACVADTKSYALLDIERQLKIPLMSISSLDDPPPVEEVGQALSIANAVGGITRSASSAENMSHPAAQSHGCSASLGGSILGTIQRHESRPSEGGGRISQQTSSASPSASPQPLLSTPEPASHPPPADKLLPAARAEIVNSYNTLEPQPGPKRTGLKPHIASLTAEEFLVVIGTGPSEPGIGMFVNLGGDATRATIGFDRYPKQIAVDGTPADLNSSRSRMPVDDAYVLAAMVKSSGNQLEHGLEIQRWDAGSEEAPQKHWLAVECTEELDKCGIRSLSGRGEVQFQDIIEKLSHRRFSPLLNTTEPPVPSREATCMREQTKERGLREYEYSQDVDTEPDGWEAARTTEGEEFARRLAKAEAKLAVWAGDRVWWAVRNPLILQLDLVLDAASPHEWADTYQLEKESVFSVLQTIRGVEARTELQFLSLGYLRQKAGLLLIFQVLTSPDTELLSDGELAALEVVLLDSKLDVRVILSLVPGLRNEIIEGPRGIWVYGGVKKVADVFLRSAALDRTLRAGLGSLGFKVVNFLRRFLSSWRKMKGFGSVADENRVFRTVDAALLTVLLELDGRDPAKGPGKGDAVRTELNNIVDRGVDCFERAVDLLESYHRLFVLSRLYQSRKMAGEVLATWKRIMEGERDDGQELRDGEQQVQEYLAKISNQTLVQEYGVWLASRNPRLGVQVFAEEKGRAPKFEPAQVLQVLRKEAPNAVKYYLEHLVFGQRNTSYVNELITYYLDVVLGELESSAASRKAVSAAHDAYRALQAPKPTYQHFLAERAPDGDEIWQSRLRLLQLLSGPHDFDSTAIRTRISRLSGELLVPETIILAGREQHHDDALRLLVHNLGDYDTAVSYCLRGGISVYASRESHGFGDRLSDVVEQRRLFQVVLREFLAIDNVGDQVEQTGALLEHFGAWFDVAEVLRLVPDSWSVEVVAGFLIGAMKKLVREKHENMMIRALSRAENLRVNYDLTTMVEDKGPVIESSNDE